MDWSLNFLSWYFNNTYFDFINAAFFQILQKLKTLIYVF